MTAEPTGFLYPFIEAEENDTERLLADLARSACDKIADSQELRANTLLAYADEIRRAARAMAERFRAGGRLFAFGNGGSATDAAGTVELFRDSVAGRALPAISLVDDRAVLTALANDIGFDLVFSRQIIAHAHVSDMVIGFSTSGDSVNILRAFDEASERNLLSLGLCGYSGGAMAASEKINHCFVVPSDSIHRIQETQDALVLALWSWVQHYLEEGEPYGR